MKRTEIEANLRALGLRLHARGLTGEILIVGGAYMLLVVRNREATRDIDAYFDRDPDAIRTEAAAVARERGLPEDWLNDAVKGFMRRKPRRIDLWAAYPGLNVYLPDPEYVFAMKAEAARPGTSDIDDLKALISLIGIKNLAEALAVVEGYIPPALRSMRAQLTLEALFEGVQGAAADLSWVVVRFGGAPGVRKTHLARPDERRTLCGRPMRVPTPPAERAGDPQAALGPALCATCHGAWRALATAAGSDRMMRP